MPPSPLPSLALTIMVALLLSTVPAVAAPDIGAGAPGVGGRAQGVGARIDARLTDALSGTEDLMVFVHLADEVGTEHGRSMLAEVGLRTSGVLDSVDVLIATGGPTAVRAAAGLPDVTFLEATTPEGLDVGATAYVTGARGLNREVGGAHRRLRMPDGTAIDGRGVGIAIVDTGIDGTHPALETVTTGGPSAPVVRNVTVACDPLLDFACGRAGMVEGIQTDLDGHGTHVAGIAAGRAVQGTFADTAADHGDRLIGVAPGAALYGFGAGAAGRILPGSAAAALDWIARFGHSVDPPIRVVNNSYGDPGAFDAQGVFAKLNAAVVGAGITMVWSAGNDGGDGTAGPGINRLAKDPLAGVITVANYDSAGGTGRGLDLSPGSSRGMVDGPQEWPDLAAPGTSIVAPCAVVDECLTPYGNQRVGNAVADRFVAKSGTSMAAPHVAGIIALLLQADPTLTPGEIEHLLEDTATEIVSAGPFGQDAHRPGEAAAVSAGAGHGLVDAGAAVAAVLPSGVLADTADPTDRTVADLPDAAGDSLSAEVDLLGTVAHESEDGTELVVRWTLAEAPTLETTYVGVLIAAPAGQLLLDVPLGSVDVSANPLRSLPASLAPTRVERAGVEITAWFPLEALGAAAGSILAEVRPYVGVAGRAVDGRGPTDLVEREATSGGYVVRGA